MCYTLPIGKREFIEAHRRPGMIFVPENLMMIRASFNPTMPLQPSFFSSKAARLSTTSLCNLQDGL
jgi:hypothetical protein